MRAGFKCAFVRSVFLDFDPGTGITAGTYAHFELSPGVDTRVVTGIERPRARIGKFRTRRNVIRGKLGTIKI
jgi:hypothetical protein